MTIILFETAISKGGRVAESIEEETEGRVESFGDSDDGKRGQRSLRCAEEVGRGSSNSRGSFFRQVLSPGDDVGLVILEDRAPPSRPALERMREIVALRVTLELGAEMRADYFDDVAVRIVADAEAILREVMLVLRRDASERFSEHGDQRDARLAERIEHGDVGFGRQQIASNRGGSSLSGRIEVPER